MLTFLRFSIKLESLPQDAGNDEQASNKALQVG